MATSPRIPHLLWAPNRLAPVAVSTSVTVAAMVGVAALVFHLTVLMLYVTALGDPPPASAGEFVGEVARGVAAAVLLAGLVVYFAQLIGQTAYNDRTQLSFKILLLSPVTMIGPVALYAALLLALAVVPEQWSNHPVAAMGQMLLAALGSCWWAPLLFLMWLWLWQRAARRVEQITPAGWPILCEQCGYDLRGTLVAERSECPECGAAIPPHAVSAALSDTQ